MPRQSRVDPFGELFADASRGTLMGNRGGRIHADNRTLTPRRWASRQWICCTLAFKNRHRPVWADSYTELFFLDEVTALAAGHRPCFECRRADARSYAACWAKAFDLARPPLAGEMDRRLHNERLDGRRMRRHRFVFNDLPDGAVIAIGAEAFAVRGDVLLRWTSTGYGGEMPRPRGGLADVLTPPATRAVLTAGYRPRWHKSAGR